jgi:hypothetical protein
MAETDTCDHEHGGAGDGWQHRGLARRRLAVAGVMAVPRVRHPPMTTCHAPIITPEAAKRGSTPAIARGFSAI